MPTALPPLSRRRALLSAAALALLGVTAAACGSAPKPPEVDELLSQLDRARSDSEVASAAAATADPAIVPALTAVAAERSSHARALTDEIARTAGEAATSSSATTTTTTTSTAAAAGPTANDVVAALRDSADSAAQLAARLSGYRAGLLGSIAASCTAAFTVALVPPVPAP
ncbi:MAG: hypothetical protein JWR37_3373 [Mycobacterium sp.]|nr:hypothetical protein [Mycobacterium sp.]